jgi:hypothetical protein
VNVCCWQCSGDFNLGINLNSLKSTCWRCGPKSKVWTFVAITGLSKSEVIDKLDLIESIEDRKRHAGKLTMPSGLIDLTDAHLEYLEGRRFDAKEIVREWKVMATGQISEIPWHIVIPVHYRREVVSWTARRIRDKGRRYFTAPDEKSAVSIKDTLYGADKANNVCVVHEGPTDVWRTGPGAVCTYGIAWTTAQLLLLSRFAKRVVCFDSEPEAQHRARKLCAALRLYDGETLNVVLDAPDAGSASDHEIQLLRRELL